VPTLFRRERPGGRAIVLAGHTHQEQPIMLSEFGGIAYCNAGAGLLGLLDRRHPDRLAARYTELLEAVRSTARARRFCYTQFTDTYQEANGLLDVNRTRSSHSRRSARRHAVPRVSRQTDPEPPKRPETGTTHDEAAP
jgi:hypothetical protein